MKNTFANKRLPRQQMPPGKPVCEKHEKYPAYFKPNFCLMSAVTSVLNVVLI